jgi:hypothetical protein
MDQDQQRDPAEERYNREFCPACGTSPCGWDGKPDGFHADETATVPVSVSTRDGRAVFHVSLADLRRAAQSGTVNFTAPPGWRFGRDRRLHPDSEAPGQEIAP